MFKTAKKIYSLIAWQFGVDLGRLLRGIVGIPRFINDLLRFRRCYTGKLALFPCLHDWYEEGGGTRNEYFLQDLYVARKVYTSNPAKHVDIGSRIDGFVAHVASFRDIEVFDVRPITSNIPGLIFKQADLMTPLPSLVDYCDSISCLHALEHFGLGRYGDPIDPLGYAAGLENMSTILRTGGIFYLSVPIGLERVEFNAHRVFKPQEIVRSGKDNGLRVIEFAWIGPSLTITQSTDLEQDLNELCNHDYALGIFTFIKQ